MVIVRETSTSHLSTTCNTYDAREGERFRENHQFCDRPTFVEIFYKCKSVHYQNSLCPSATKSQSNMHTQRIKMFHFLLSLILSSLLLVTSDIIPAVPDLSAGINIAITTPTVTPPQDAPTDIIPPQTTPEPPQEVAPAEPQQVVAPAEPQQVVAPAEPQVVPPAEPQQEVLSTEPQQPAPGAINIDPNLQSLHKLPKFPKLPHLPKLGFLDPMQDPSLANSGDENLAREFLKLHNTARGHAKLPPFYWDVKLEEYARQYASERANGDCADMVHSMGPYGENLFWGKGSSWKPRDAVKKWIKEHKFYDQESNACKHGRTCGHYTQVVWRDSTRLGCAVARCKNDDTFTVCSYDPPGNYLGERPYIHYDH